MIFFQFCLMSRIMSLKFIDIFAQTITILSTVKKAILMHIDVFDDIVGHQMEK